MKNTRHMLKDVTLGLHAFVAFMQNKR